MRADLQNTPGLPTFLRRRRPATGAVLTARVPRGIVRSILLAALILLSAALAAKSSASDLLQILPASKAEYLRLLEAAPESRDCGAVLEGDAVRFPAAEGRAEQLRSLGFSVEVLVADLESFYASRIHQRDDFGAYHTYTEAIEAMDALVATHPDLISPKQSIGTTIEGRPIWVYKISDNPTIDEDEPELFFNAYIHSREAITFEVVYDLAQQLLNGYGLDPRLTTIVNTREIWLQPCVNPDGVEYNALTNPNGGGMWRKNRRNNGDGTWGVDLNRNFGYEWGYDNNGSSPYGYSETYRGTGPFSEPETEAMRDFVLARPFSIVLNYHSYSNLHIFAWGYDTLHHDDYDEILALGQVRQVNNGYGTGTTWEVLYHTNGDANDWMYGDSGIFSFVSEVGTSGDGFWPPESRIPALVAENREANLRMCELADDPLRALGPGWAEAALPDTVPANFTVVWTVPQPDPSNPAVSWNLLEATGHTVGADDLEGGTSTRWSARGWELRTNRSHSPTHSFWGGNQNKQNSLLVSRRGHRVQPGEQLRFWTWYSIEQGWDYGYVEVATSDREYTALPGSITTNSDPNGQNLGNGITGSSNGWVQATFDLSAYAGEVVWLRFRYNTDGNVTGEGWYVDDIEPADLFATESLVGSEIPLSQYEFTGHPEGTFSFLVQSIDGEGDTSVWGPPETVVVGAPTAVDPIPVPIAWRGLEFTGRHPFAAEIGLRFTVPADAREGEPVQLHIFDPAGRRRSVLIESVVGEGVRAGETVQAAWAPGDLPAGLYFARLLAGARRSEQKLVYLP